MNRGRHTVFWKTILMLRRELDQHVSDKAKLELPKWAWSEAVRRCEEAHHNVLADPTIEGLITVAAMVLHHREEMQLCDRYRIIENVVIEALRINREMK
jgi:hypothetical protein